MKTHDGSTVRRFTAAVLFLGLLATGCAAVHRPTPTGGFERADRTTPDDACPEFVCER